MPPTSRADGREMADALPVNAKYVAVHPNSRTGLLDAMPSTAPLATGVGDLARAVRHTRRRARIAGPVAESVGRRVRSRVGAVGLGFTDDGSITLP